MISIAVIDSLLQNLPVLAGCGSGHVIVVPDNVCTHLKLSRNRNTVEVLEMTKYEKVEVEMFLQSPLRLPSGGEVHWVS